MTTREELLKTLKAGRLVYNHAWWFQMHDDGNIFGGCDEPDCCQLEYDNFDDMYDDFDKEDWHL